VIGDIEFRLLTATLHADIDHRCALEMESVKADAEFATRSIAQRFRRLRERIRAELGGVRTERRRTERRRCWMDEDMAAIGEDFRRVIRDIPPPIIE
jgi:hypothetical protein